MNTLISPNDTWTLWAVIVAGTAASIWLEHTYKWAAKLSGPVLALVIAMALSNTSIMPAEAPSYAFVGDFLVPLAIPLLLMRANFFRIARNTGWMFIAFHISVFGTVLGAVLATLLLNGHVDQIAEVAAIMTASYSGGGVNFFAVRESFGVSENLTNPLLVADNFIMAGMILILISIAGNAWFRRHYNAPHATAADEDEGPAQEQWRRKPVSMMDIAAGLAVAFVVIACAHLTHDLLTRSFAESVVVTILGNLFVLITFYSMLAATCFGRIVEKINGSEEIGGFLLYVFLFAIGLPADIPAVIQNAPVLLIFCLIMAMTNLIVTLLIGRLLRINLEDLLISVSATLGGPPTALALTIAKGWPKLAAPALLVGIWGYVIGTLLGVMVGELLRRFV
ncbi:hypothetical protein Mal64_07820 [Pseudobythopirellula maris]|uniref:DUF819 domain-containing protein n=1 Tax=Pseudobythopirellula maris TaxID=2527991 RepID=A0A5C5ZVX0_9BACT|nr:DUF819 family protein [Pseudobythopirellula maris]TWT90393.1 hypothetical protein Mal64_07820 [Pseudobythopirellula maris]